MLDRADWATPPPNDPALAHITPELRSLAIPIDRLAHLPGNYHQGDVGVVIGSIDRFTQRKPIVVNRHTGHVEAGNTTLDAITARHHQWIAAVLVEDDPDTEKAYAIVDNRAQERGFNDPALLAVMLIEVHQASEQLFAGTGYDGDDLDQLLHDLEIDLADTPQLDDPTPQHPPENGHNPQHPKPAAEPLDLPRGTWNPDPHPEADHTPHRTVTFEIAVPFNLRFQLTERLQQLQNQHGTLTMGEALATHFQLNPIT